MKKISYIAIALLFLTIKLLGQTSDADKVIGIWLSEKKDCKMEILKSGNKYYGKFLWGKDIYEADGKTPLKDTKNPDVNLRNRTRLNMIFLSDLIYDDGEYTGGKLYNGQNGSTYSCKLKLEEGKLKMRAYLGFSLLGGSVIWTRVK